MPVESRWFPERLRPWGRRVRCWAMTIGPLLMILGAALAARGVSYLSGGPGTHPAESIMPVSVWGWVWVTLGGVCLVVARWPTGRVARISLATAAALHMFWGASFASATLLGQSERGWVSSVGYFSVVALVVVGGWLVTRLDAERQKSAALEKLVSALPTEQEVRDELDRSRG